MEKVIGLFLVFLVGVQSCTVSTGPSDEAVTTGDYAKLTCSIENANLVSWERIDQASSQPVTVWTDQGGSTDSTLYSVTSSVVGSTTTFTLTIDPVSKEIAGTYTCSCFSGTAPISGSAVLTVLDNPSCSLLETITPMEYENVTLRCHVIFASIDFNTYEPTVYYLDSNNQQMVANQTNIVDSTGKYLANQIWIESNLQVTWEDNGRDYICYSEVKNTNNQEIYSDNCTQRVTVLHMGRNFTISPDKSTYYHGENIYVYVQANPEPNQIKWTYMNSSTVVAENSNYITVPTSWSGNTTLKIEVMNNINSQNYTATYTFWFDVTNSASGARHLTVALLHSLLPVLGAISLNMMSR